MIGTMKNIKTSKIMSALALVAFFASVMLPFFATYNLSSDKEVSSIFGEKVLICTADGFKWISLEDAKNGEFPNKHDNVKCPVCFFLANTKTSFVPKSPSSVLYIQTSFQIKYFELTTTFKTHSFGNLSLARAPPVSSLV